MANASAVDKNIKYKYSLNTSLKGFSIDPNNSECLSAPRKQQYVGAVVFVNSRISKAIQKRAERKARASAPSTAVLTPAIRSRTHFRDRMSWHYGHHRPLSTNIIVIIVCRKRHVDDIKLIKRNKRIGRVLVKLHRPSNSIFP